jgi:ABC-type phosphate/phosphonate transport system permease subunit
MGAVGGGGLGGAYRHSKSGKSWWDASQKWKNVRGCY